MKRTAYSLGCHAQLPLDELYRTVALYNEIAPDSFRIPGGLRAKRGKHRVRHTTRPPQLTGLERLGVRCGVLERKDVGLQERSPRGLRKQKERQLADAKTRDERLARWAQEPGMNIDKAYVREIEWGYQVASR